MDIQNYIDDYVKWLKSEISFTKMGEYYEITSPFLDVNNDYTQIYVKQEENNIIFTDDSNTLYMLESHGFSLTPNRKQQLKNILDQFGVSLKGHELTMRAPANEFPQRKHMFIQAILRVSDMYMTARSKVSSLFTDDIATYFEQNEIYCSPNIQMLGKSGFSHNYDFLIQRSKNKPERLCMAINTPSKNSMNNTLFIWEDTKQARNNNCQLIVFLNDSNTIQHGVEVGFENYGVKTIRWSEKENPDNLGLLSA